ncbi:MAG: Ig-like domain-containing protein [Candidatus Omnitrophota bacterium]
MKTERTCFVTIGFMIFMILLSTPIFGAIPAEERAALIALYNNTHGDNWYDKTGWKNHPLNTDGFSLPGTEDHWLGVTVENNHVTELRLPRNGLIGVIPPELGHLGQLTYLWLADNALSGSIPAELGNLSKLIRLAFDGCELTGNLPTELGNLTYLQFLILHNNHLSGSIPPEIGNLRNLEWLILDMNNLSGPIPPQLGNLSNLQTLKLDHNELSGGIPPELENLTHLCHLYLNNNRLSGEIPSYLAHFPCTYGLTLDLSSNCLMLWDPVLRAWLGTHNPDWDAHQDQCVSDSKNVVHLSRTKVFLSAPYQGESNTQTVELQITGNQLVKWIATRDVPWLFVNPADGNENATLVVSTQSAYLDRGRHTGTLTIYSPNAINSSQMITVTLDVHDPETSSAPFGEIETPLNGSYIDKHSIPITGWALDDRGVTGVKIYKDNTYIGDAVFVEGTRPDIEVAYPGYPNNHKAGWAYLLLTDTLPNHGNGTYTLSARAQDADGNDVLLGSKLISVDHTHAVKPFGSIDTPTPCETASGKELVNFGWVLTPQPNMIPVDGSTIDVVIDGVKKGNPVYNNYRSDIAALFPTYANTNGAVGYFYIDTTTLANGLHTIAWDVTDNGGNRDGIGSRYFSVENPESTDGASKRHETADKQAETFCPNDTNMGCMEVTALGRLELNLCDESLPHFTHIRGYLMVGDRLRPLPVGSTLDQINGRFYWQLGPGFVGEYRLVFIETDDTGHCIKKSVTVKVI